MIRATIIATMVPAASLACDFNGSSVTATRVPGGVDIELHNQLVPSPDVTTCTILLDGGEVIVTWSHMAGDDPDEIAVTPPDGYIASPQFVTVPEGKTARVAIREWSGM